MEEAKRKRLKVKGWPVEPNVVRVYDFEKPFSKEEIYNPPMLQVPRISRLKGQGDAKKAQANT